MPERIDGRKLAEIRKSRRYTIKAVAQIVGIHPNTLAEIEAGRIPLHADSELARELMQIYEVHHGNIR